MAVLERTYTIPLRREFLKSPKYKRTKKAGIALRQFLVKHMKSEDVLIGRYLNLELWKHGIRNPPSRVKVTVSKDDKGVVRAELFGVLTEKQQADKKLQKKEEKKGEKKEVKPESLPVEQKSAEKPQVPKVKSDVKKSFVENE